MSEERRIPELVQAELRELTEVNSGIAAWVRENPTDRTMLLLKEQNDYRLQLLLDELEDSFAFFGHSVLSYRFVAACNLEITNITRHLNSLQVVISKTLSMLQNKDNCQLPLYFSTVFQGSTGIILSSAAEPGQLLPGFAEETFSTFFKILSALQSHQNIDDIFQGNRMLLRAYRSFFKELKNTVCPVDLSAKLSVRQDKIHISEINQEIALSVYTDLANYEKDNSITATVTGNVVAINLIDKTIQIIPNSRNGVQIKLYFDNIPQEKAMNALGKGVEIQYREDTNFDIETNKISVEKHILSLQRIE